MSKTRSTRNQNMRLFGHLYSRTSDREWSRCYYCGGPRQVFDHAPPISVTASIDIEKFKRSGGRFELVPSCTPCNSLLGAAKVAEKELRMASLYASLTARVECLPNWSDQEVAELGHTLKTMIGALRIRNRETIEHHRRVEQRMLAVTSPALT